MEDVYDLDMDAPVPVYEMKIHTDGVCRAKGWKGSFAASGAVHVKKNGGSTHRRNALPDDEFPATKRRADIFAILLGLELALISLYELGLPEDLKLHWPEKSKGHPLEPRRAIMDSRPQKSKARKAIMDSRPRKAHSRKAISKARKRQLDMEIQRGPRHLWVSENSLQKPRLDVTIMTSSAEVVRLSKLDFGFLPPDAEGALDFSAIEDGDLLKLIFCRRCEVLAQGTIRYKLIPKTMTNFATEVCHDKLDFMHEYGRPVRGWTYRTNIAQDVASEDFAYGPLTLEYYLDCTDERSLCPN
ncbi:hypothetical protein BT63DRAFT_416391 [Microthyrium microscopicum]|uniref:RNase H type-1 domain-containing protein n=1 Tax=Microthyrium microscopicum TaxID=703497 RepID=A0A6A6U217_9PEZI|nr:hypothetical protein BT63DRAFT_416391 [Microthyrium microscopicum]